MTTESSLYFAIEKPVPFVDFRTGSIIEGFCPVCGSPVEWAVVSCTDRADALYRTSPLLVLDCRKQPACDCPETSLYFTFESEGNSGYGF